MSNNLEYAWRFSEVLTSSALDAFHRAGEPPRDYSGFDRITELLNPNPCETED